MNILIPCPIIAPFVWFDYSFDVHNCRAALSSITFYSDGSVLNLCGPEW
jgi:hypothetical protein